MLRLWLILAYLLSVLPATYQLTGCKRCPCVLQTFRGRSSLRSMEAVHKWLLELGKCLCIRFDWGSS